MSDLFWFVMWEDEVHAVRRSDESLSFDLICGAPAPSDVDILTVWGLPDWIPMLANRCLCEDCMMIMVSKSEEALDKLGK